MDALFVSTAAVAFAEIGDKTQLLGLVLAMRYRAPLAISLGILFATLANHALASFIGILVAGWLTPEIMRWIIAVSFIAMAAWALIPDRLDDEPRAGAGFGAFMATLIGFFIVETGDKTQIATVALAASFQSVLLVTLGTTLGMMLANVPVVFAGKLFARHIRLRLVRMIAAVLFFVLGIGALFA
jgi:putative Ca2+/H+ antiporter (TMEM165/GDT1 family)